jgi:hypothetical protein
MAITLNIMGLEATITGLQGVYKSIAKSKAIVEGGMYLHSEVLANISLTDHSLKDLADMDHPYARRHGSIQIHPEKPWAVHRQGGELVRALRRRTTRYANSAKFEVYFDQTVAPHALYVVKGTRKMLARDVIWNTATDKRVRTGVMLKVIQVLGQDMRSKAGVRFKV